MRLFDNAVSGNAYKVRLLLAHLGKDYERIEVSVVDRSNREDLLGAKNPALRIPVLEFDDGTTLGESNAILWFLAQGTDYLPHGARAQAEVLQWMFFEQYDHEPNIAVARFLLHFAPEADPDVVAVRQEGGGKALAAMERRLTEHAFLVGDRYSIADIALYAYTHVADEAGLSLDPYPSVAAWVNRVASQPGHIAIDA